MTALWGVFLLLKQSLFGIQRCRTWGRLCGVVLTGEDIHQTVVLLNGDYRAFGIHVNPSVLCRFFHVFMISELKISLFPLSFPLARLAKGHGKAGKGNSRGSPLPVEIVRGGHPARVCENVGEGVTPVAPERERERVTNYLELPNNPTTNLQEKLLFPALLL